MEKVLVTARKAKNPEYKKFWMDVAYELFAQSRWDD